MVTSNPKKENDLVSLSEEELAKDKAVKAKLRKAEAKARKETSRGKREKAGLVEKSIFLEQKIYDRFQALADSLEHKVRANGLSSEQLSMVVHYLLDFYEQPKGIEVPLTADGQYLYRVHRVLKYRKNLEKNNSYRDVASFMIEHKYVVPKNLTELDMVIPRKPKYCWSSDLVQILLNAKFINDQILKLNASSPIFLPINATVNQQSSIIGNSSSDAFEDDLLELAKLDEPFEYDDDDLGTKELRKTFEKKLEKLYGRYLGEDEFFENNGMEKEAAFNLYKKECEKGFAEDDDDDIDFDDFS
ncbi:hypothetical protein [Vibrio toranzoniae]|uniref:hypothetical protein n=1 Tax=Vibrio toranzoniae TaxID=1194427 RepID=UPI001378E620|nr:hypothetical protein [Vibrio toranzoniae]NAZ70558.1 hypothetical protein [Vibrio toranzoniae]